jgi:3-oxoacyl-[acyl-carrier protein] reductase
MTADEPLSGRFALVTGVSRQMGIAGAVAEHLVDLGATVHASGWPPHDAEMPWGTDPIGETRFEIEERDLGEASAPAALIDAVVDRFGALDIVVAVHARSGSGSLDTLTADDLDRCWAVNVRSVVLLAQRFAQRRDRNRPGGRMLWFTSGQHLQPMPLEVPYAISKAALHQMTPTVADALANVGIVANCINPGPVDTGYAVGDLHARVARMFPGGQWGTPAHVADLVGFLVSEAGGWIQGQVIDSEGGFRRSR